MRRFCKLAFVPLVLLLTAADGRAQTPTPAAPGSPKSKPAKSRETHRAPVSELITRILAEEARLDTARRLSALAVTPDEKQLAQKALRLADHQLDLAFFVALRRAADNPEPPTPQLAALESAVKTLQSGVDEEQAVVDKLKKQLARARGRRKEALGAELEMEQAKLELAKDELAGAREDLIDAGGDLKSQIERLQADLAAAEKTFTASTASPAAAGAASADVSSDTLLEHLKQWMAKRTLRVQLQAARDDAADAVESLHQRMEGIEKELATLSAAAPAPPAQPAKKAAGGPAPPQPASGAAVELLQRQSRLQKILASNKLRIHDMTGLAGTYDKWDALEALKQKDVTRKLMFSALWIALIVLLGIISNRLLQRLFLRMTQERRRLHTLRTMSRFGLQALCLAVILLVVLGPPSQLATLLAFAGAGLTVALKDFIVSFIGWFMLMGRNGVHAGDWVEINGICGEVIEVNLFHTVLLETGNWNNPGYPTGRKVSFTNSYAIEGHYFNFTTSGQWMWDELEFLIPQGKNPNEVADAILKMVTLETQAEALLAGQEWSRLAPKAETGGAAQPPSPAPVLAVRPTAFGITGSIRYLTRANQRYQARVHLYHQIVEFLHGGSPQPGETAPAPASS